MRRGLTAVAATSLAAALLALAQPGAGSAAAAPKPTDPAGSTPSTSATSEAGTGGAGAGAERPALGETPGSGDDPAGGTGDPVVTVDRQVSDSRIIEASGMVSSVRHRGLVWVHEDSGRAPRVFGIGTNGRTDAVLTLRGVENQDWEAMTLTKDVAGRQVLAVGDIGDNNAVRKEIRVLLFREPEKLRDVKVNVQRVLRLEYPGGAADAETLVADPRNQRLYIVTKGLLGGEIYAVPQAAWPGGSDATAESRAFPLTFVAKVDMSLVTDGIFLPDGRLVLRNYGSATIFADPSKVTTGSLEPQSTAELPSQPQGESIALSADGTALLIGSEGSKQPIMRVALPDRDVVGATAPVSTSTGDSPSAAAKDEGGISTFLLVLVIAGVVVLLLIFGAVLVALR